MDAHTRSHMPGTKIPNLLSLARSGDHSTLLCEALFCTIGHKNQGSYSMTALRPLVRP
jgi:hypothetical protein